MQIFKAKRELVFRILKWNFGLLDIVIQIKVNRITKTYWLDKNSFTWGLNNLVPSLELYVKYSYKVSLLTIFILDFFSVYLSILNYSTEEKINFLSFKTKQV